MKTAISAPASFAGANESDLTEGFKRLGQALLAETVSLASQPGAQPDGVSLS